MTTKISAQKKKPRAVRDLTIVGEGIRYFLLLFVPFALIGGIYGFLAGTIFMNFIVNPLIYAGGITTIIIICKHDVNDILALIGRAREHKLALHIQHGQTIQKISLLMSAGKYTAALKAVDALLEEEPRYPNALNLKGQILLEGFRKFDAARTCFEKVMDLTGADSEDYKLAEALAAATYGDNQD